MTSIIFKGVNYEILVETNAREYVIHSIKAAEVGSQVGINFGPEDLHVMQKLEAY